MKNKYFLILVFCILFISRGYSQNIIRNFGFEDLDAMFRPVSWIPQNPNGKYFIAPNPVAHAGVVAMVIASKTNDDENRGVGLFNSILTKNLLSGKKKLVITTYIKTENLTDGIASIWMQLNGTAGIISDKNCDDKSAKGNSDWTKYSIELPLTDGVQSVGFGCKMTGKGKAYFDDFEVLIDDVPLK